MDNVDCVVKQTAILKNIRPLPALTLCIALLIEMFIFIPSISTTFRVRNYRRQNKKAACYYVDEGMMLNLILDDLLQESTKMQEERPHWRIQKTILARMFKTTFFPILTCQTF